jgi:flagellar biosynthesis/type III secretory pathway protein FliH
MNKHNRIRELEDKAIELYLNEAEWQYVISHLTNAEHDEYWRLVNEKCGF